MKTNIIENGDDYSTHYKKTQYAKIPLHDMEEVPEEMRGDFFEMEKNSYPFAGNGFTPATGKDASGKERLGTPEVVAKPPKPIDKAVIVRIDSEGNEVIVGYSVERIIEGKRVK